MKTTRKATKNPGLGEQIRNAEVTAADLKKAIETIDSLPEESRKDVTARSIATLRAFGLLNNDTDEPNDENHKIVAKITAIQVRIEAMARLVDSKRFRPWTMHGTEDGLTYIREYFLEVAATAPLLGGERDEPGYFDEDDFARRMLESCREEGRA